MLGEDVQDQRGPVDHLDPQSLLQVAQLPRGKLPIADDGVRSGGRHDLGELGDLAGADVGRGVGLRSALHHRVQDDRTGRFRERGELRHRRVRLARSAGSLTRRSARRACDSVATASPPSDLARRAGLAAPPGPHADQHHPLELQLAVLDLADVGELRGQSSDATQRGPVRKVPLAGGGRRVPAALLVADAVRAVCGGRGPHGGRRRRSVLGGFWGVVHCVPAPVADKNRL